MIRAFLWLSLFLAMSSGCSFDGSPVHFVVPNGFTGKIRLVLDESGGTEIKRVDGRYTCRIPSSGVMRVTSFDAFEPMHIQTAAYEDGTPIPQDYETWTGPYGEKPRLGKNAVVFHGGSLGQRDDEPPMIKYFVGSTLEYEEWHRQKNPFTSDTEPENR